MASEKDADKLMAQAEKALKPSILSMRMRPKWDEAYPMFEKAAVQYKVLNKLEKAALAYEKAAEANLNGGGTSWHAGKHLEAAARCTAELGKHSLAVDLFRRAAENYTDAGKPSVGAEALGNGARLLESAEPGTSGDLYREALELYSRANLSTMAHDVAQRGVAAAVRGGDFEGAAAMLLKWGGICSSNENYPLMCKAFLGVIVLHMHRGDTKAAWAVYQDFLDVQEFASSPEAFAAEDLMQAYGSGRADYIQQAVRRGRSWTGLDGQVARLAKALPSPHGDLKAMAASVREVLGDVADESDGDDGDVGDDLDLT